MTDPRFKPGCLTPEPIHFIVPFPQSIPKYRYAKIYFFTLLLMFNLTCRLNSIFHYISNAALNIYMHISFVHMLVLLLIKSLETDTMGQRHGYLTCDSYYHTEDTLTCSSYTCMPMILNFWSSDKIFPILCPILYNSII